MKKRSEYGTSNRLIVRELKTLQRQINDLQLGMKKLSDKYAPFLMAPDFVLNAARDRLNETKSWNSCYRVLSSWFQIPEVHALVSAEKMPKGAIACYYPTENFGAGMIYSKTTTMSDHTGLHEFAHHLCEKRLKIGGETEQAFCDSFANEVLKVWNRRE